MEGETYKVRDMLVMDEDRKKKITRNKGETFVIKAPTPKENRQISQSLAMNYYNGLPVNSYSPDDRYLYERDASIDVLIDEHPNFWTKAEDCLDNSLKEWLYTEIMKWTAEFQEKLKKNQFAKGNTKEPVQS